MLYFPEGHRLQRIKGDGYSRQRLWKNLSSREGTSSGIGVRWIIDSRCFLVGWPATCGLMRSSVRLGCSNKPVWVSHPLPSDWPTNSAKVDTTYTYYTCVCAMLLYVRKSCRKHCTFKLIIRQVYSLATCVPFCNPHRPIGLTLWKLPVRPVVIARLSLSDYTKWRVYIAYNMHKTVYYDNCKLQWSILATGQCAYWPAALSLCFIHTLSAENVVSLLCLLIYIPSVDLPCRTWSPLNSEN